MPNGYTVYPSPSSSSTSSRPTHRARKRLSDTKSASLSSADAEATQKETVEKQRHANEIHDILGQGPRFRSNPLKYIIRLTSDSAAFISGEGWRSYSQPIGQKILYPQLTTDIQQSVLDAPELRQYIAEHHRAFPQTASLAKQMLLSLEARLSSATIVRFFAFVMNHLLMKMYQEGIHIRQNEFEVIQKAAQQAAEEGHALLLLPSHKSHVDYLVISYILYRLGLALPFIAAGENLNLPLVGWILRHGGAFMIRRVWSSTKKEPPGLYALVSRLYITEVLRRGHNMEVFIEGTRSRTGKLLNPKFGIVKIIIDGMLKKDIKDCVVVPVSIGYDKVIETSSYVDELLGRPKEAESLLQVFNATKLLGVKLGRIDVRFATPFKISDFLKQQDKRRQSAADPLAWRQDKQLVLQTFAYRVLADINNVTVLMPTAIVGTIILTLRGRGVGKDELIRRVDWLREQIILRSPDALADWHPTPTAHIVDRALVVLKDLVGIHTDLLEPVIYPTKRFELSYYRNQMIHLFIGETIFSCSLYVSIKKGQTHKRVSFSHMLQDIAWLSSLMKLEFVFRPGTVKENTDLTIAKLNEQGMLDVNEEGVALTAEEKASGRENFDFFCFMLWPFIESYWLGAVGLLCVDWSHTNGGGLLEKDLVVHIQNFGRTLYHEGDLGYFEALNKETLANAIKRLCAKKLLIPVYPGSSLVRPAPTFAPFVGQKYESLAAEDQAIHTSQYWGIAEKIGMYRREGKHRRDNESTSERVFRLARLARYKMSGQKAPVFLEKSVQQQQKTCTKKDETGRLRSSL